MSTEPMTTTELEAALDLLGTLSDDLQAAVRRLVEHELTPLVDELVRVIADVAPGGPGSDRGIQPDELATRVGATIALTTSLVDALPNAIIEHRERVAFAACARNGLVP